MSQRPSTTATLKRALLRGLREIERGAAGARRRVEPSPAAPGPQDAVVDGPADGRYGKLWDPGADAEAMSLILNTSDTDAFEAAGRGDADRFAPFITPEATVLDLGCGIGRVAKYVAPLCRTLWAVDASPRMLELARKRLADAPNVRFARCIDTAIPDVATASVDVAYALLVLQHLEREDAFVLLKELRRVLKPEGVAFVTYPNLLSDVYLQSFLDYVREGQVTNPARARIYTPQEVERLMPEAGFAVTLDPGVEIFATCRPR
jgi:SAM-dependent methyltransferase